MDEVQQYVVDRIKEITDDYNSETIVVGGGRKRPFWVRQKRPILAKSIWPIHLFHDDIDMSLERIRFRWQGASNYKTLLAKAK